LCCHMIGTLVTIGLSSDGANFKVGILD
jgi:hypothetical protein